MPPARGCAVTCALERPPARGPEGGSSGPAPDGQSRWVHAWTPESEPERHLSPREWLALFLLASLLWAAIIVAVTVW
jgi:hypothetical protein